jgi:acyl-CoA thioesterase II
MNTSVAGLPGHPGPEAPREISLTEVLDLEVLDATLYRSTLMFEEPYSLYGGQVAAQALRAAGLSVPEGRLPHSLHGYFLRPGDPSAPLVYRVERDRDGGSFSARRVVALQDDAVIFTMSASFHVGGPGADRQFTDTPDVPRPEDCTPWRLPRLWGFEARTPVPVAPGALPPTRFWARAVEPLPDDRLLHACALTYLSDISSGLLAVHDEESATGPSLDHALWLHRPVRADEWILMDHTPYTVAAGRGWYTGTFHDAAGLLVAAQAQEALFRARRRP